MEYGADVNFPTDKGSTPLHAASYHGHEDIINLLISYGADINKKNEFGLTPSDNAATNRYKEIIISSQNDRILNLQ